MSPSSGRRRVALASGASCIALVLALATGELAVRTLRRSSLLPGVFPIALEPDALGWHPAAAAATARHRGRDFEVVYHLDAGGHRSTAGARAPHTADLVFVGDSLTFGWGVAAEEAFPHLVGRGLGLSAANLGVPGYGADQSLLHLRAHGLPLRPHLVVFTSCANDSGENARAVAYGRTKPYFTQDARGMPVLHPAGPRRPWVEGRSDLWRVARSRYAGVIGPVDSAASRHLADALVRAMADAAMEVGAGFLVAHHAEPWLAASLEGVAGAASTDLSRVTVSEPIIFAEDPHWNAAGHRAVARKILDELRATGLAPARWQRAAGSSGPP